MKRAQSQVRGGPRTSRNREVQPMLYSSVNDIIERPGFTTTQAHVGNGALVLVGSASSPMHCILPSLDCSPFHTADDIRHRATAVGAEYLDGDETSFLGHTILAGGNDAGAVGAVAIVVIVVFVLWDRLAPNRTALEFDVVNVDASVDDIDVNTFATSAVIDVLGESVEGEFRSVTDTRKSLMEHQSLEFRDEN